MIGGVVMDEPETIPIPAFDLSRLTYGDLRRLQTVDATNLDGLALLDGILEKAVVGGLDAIPIAGLKSTIVALMAEITAAMSGKGITGRAVLAGLRDGRVGDEHYMSLQLCRLYHCTPLELEIQPLDVVLAHIACIEAEAQAQKIEATRAAARARRKR